MDPVQPLDGLILSLGFWACLVAAAVLFSCVSLAPRIVERERMRQEFAERQGELLTLQAEVAHLKRLADALEQDPSLSRSLARHDLRRPPVGVEAVPVTEQLRYDPRRAAPAPIDVDYSEPWYLGILAGLAGSREQRMGWSLTAAGLLVFGFVFLHEQAGSRTLFRALATPLTSLVRRYRIDHCD